MELSRSTAKAKRACADKGCASPTPSRPLLCGRRGRRSAPASSGYYARHRAVDAALRSFDEAARGRALDRIVALGAGLDGSFWRPGVRRGSGPCECAYFEALRFGPGRGGEAAVDKKPPDFDRGRRAVPRRGFNGDSGTPARSQTTALSYHALLPRRSRGIRVPIISALET